MKTQRWLTWAGAACAALMLGLGQARAGVYGPVPTIDYNYPHYANSPILTKFMDGLPGLTAAAPNNLGQYIPIAVPDPAAYPADPATGTPASDYYEIAVVEYREQMHTQLPALNNPNKTQSTTGTRLRGYVQIYPPGSTAPTTAVQLFYPDGNPITVDVNGAAVNVFAYDNPHYLGPLIVAAKNRPVRVKFYNLLPIGAAGDLFLPVDTSVAGAGPYEIDNPAGTGTVTGRFTQNRATLHLHGGLPGWESDGTAHQWITPAGDPAAANYPKGQSVRDVPDMGIQGNGSMTFYWPNQQSGRLLFYHDHAWGMTAADVYAGEAAGYLVVDPVGEEDKLAALGVPGTLGTTAAAQDLAHLIPLVIQDKTWVWGANDNVVNLDGSVAVGPLSSGTWAVDPFWAKHAPSSVAGDLWTPHIYVPIQDPFSPDGLNPFGRWHYGPWFWPIFPAQLPLPENSHAPESFQDTPVVNGTAYPVLNVAPEKYRFKILNAAADRFWNLQLYVANPGIVGSITVTAPGSLYLAPIVTISPAPGDTTGRGATATAIADWDPASPTYGQVLAITMDVVGSGYTLPPIVTIMDAFGPGVGATATANLYSAPTEVGMVPFVLPKTAWPPGTGDPDNRIGGVPDPRMRGPAFVQIGHEGGLLPNATVINNIPMNYDWNKGSATFGNVKEHAVYLGPAERADVIVDFSNFAGKTLILYNDAPAPVPANAPYYDYYTGSPDNTGSGGAPSTLPGQGPNTRTIMQIVVSGTPSATPPPANDYAPALLTALQAPATGIPSIFASVLEAPIVPQPPYEAAFGPLPPGGPTNWYSRIQNNDLTFTPFGATAPVSMYLHPKAIAEEMDFVYARMNATLGVERPFTGAPIQTTLWFGFIDPPTEIFKDGEVQIWKLTHNGVDTHAIHFHIVNVQIINRVGWDNAVKPPAPEELGWKDTIKMNPLEDIIFAARAVTPRVPYKLPNSIRMLNPEQPSGSLLGFMNLDPITGDPVTVTNAMTNFGWEYTWHCHLLGHEEYDMMRPLSVAMPPDAPSNLTGVSAQGGLRLTFTDNAINETGFTIQLAKAANGPWTTLGTLPAAAGTGATLTFADKTYKPNATPFYYQVVAINTVGTGSAAVTVNSTPATIGPPAGVTTLAPLTQAAVARAPIVLSWSYSGTDQAGFTIQRSTTAGFTSNVTAFNVANVTTFSDVGSKAGTLTYYRVRARNALGVGAWSNVQSITPLP